MTMTRTEIVRGLRAKVARGEAIVGAGAGADVLVAHMGLTTKGMIGAKTTRTLEECVSATQAIHDAAVAEREDPW